MYLPADSLLLTKLTPPPLRGDLVLRPRLEGRLDGLLQPGVRLGLVCASAGYGKSSLVGGWLKAHPELAGAWLSLDEGDAQPGRFWGYMLAALQRAVPGLGAAAQQALASPEAPVQAALVSLLNDLSSLPSALVLVLDDYHLLETQPSVEGEPPAGGELSVHADFAFFLEHLPAPVKVILTSRQDPPLPLARLRGRGQVVELRTADLRFSAEEAGEFLRGRAGVTLDEPQLSRVMAQTEGWPAGLHLLAAALNQQADLGRLLDDLSSSGRFILEYLFSEVLSGQPQAVQRFLQRTSILERMCPPLCAAVLGESESACREVLEGLERANLFVVPLDSPPAWYRCHPLFGVLLRQRLGQVDPGGIPRLHARAAGWLEAQGFIDEALAHWLNAGEAAQAARLVSENALGALNRGELRRLAGWLGQLSLDEIDSSPWLCVYQAWLCLLSGQIPQAVERLGCAESHPPLPGDAAGHIAAIRLYMAAASGDMAAAHHLALQALELLDEESLGTRAVVWFALGGVKLVEGDFAAAAQAFRKAGEQGLAGGNQHLAISALNAWVGQLIWQGKLSQAKAEAQRALSLASTPDGRPLPHASGVLASLSRIACERDELGAALAAAQEAVSLADLWGQIEGQVFARLALVDVWHRGGELAEAARVLQDTAAMQPRYAALPFTAVQVEAALALLDARSGDSAAALRWAAGLLPGAHSLINHAPWLAQVQVLLAAGQAGEALQALGDLPEQARGAGLDGIAIRALALRAGALQQVGDGEAALGALSEALRLGEVEGAVRSLIDAGDAMPSLLRKARQARVAPAYCTRLLAALHGEESGAPAETGGLIEPLSPRELEVLRLAAQGQTNQEIAQRLYLAESTVKSHLNAVLRKLGAANRTEAAARARGIGLIP